MRVVVEQRPAELNVRLVVEVLPAARVGQIALKAAPEAANQ